MHAGVWIVKMAGEAMNVQHLHSFLNLGRIKLQKGWYIVPGTKGLVEALEHLWYIHNLNLEAPVKAAFPCMDLHTWC